MKNTLTLFLVGSALLPCLASAGPYHRFWRGTKLSSLSTTEFEAGLNENFISQTVQTGAGKGLIAYEPVLLDGAELPDEIALVSYSDQSSYNAIRATPVGQAYSALHWKYFDKSTSSSLVPESYAGDVSIERAYDLHPEFTRWMTSHTRVLIQVRNPDEDDAAYLKRIKTEFDQDRATDARSGVQGRVCLVAEGYWIEYVSNTSTASQNRSTAGISIPLEHKTTDSAKLAPGTGVDVQF